MTEFGLVDEEDVDSPGDEWEEIDVADTEADRIARKRDREFSDFRDRIKDADQFKVEASVFDDATYAAVYKLVQDGYIDAFGGPISTGKEANVYTALGGAAASDGLAVDADQPEVAVKVYRINASDFRDMRGYLEGDPRFEGIGSEKSEVVKAWVRKEFANLRRAREAGISVPRPLAVERNVLVMEFIGTATGRAKRLSEVEVEIENPQTAYEVLGEYMRRLYDAGLIHGDLSEYNVVFHEGQLVVIDVGQAVTVHHPNAEDFLVRDCENVANFFRRLGVETTTDALRAAVTERESESEGGNEGDQQPPDDATVGDSVNVDATNEDAR
jgi:RIO kinase 1